MSRASTLPTWSTDIPTAVEGEDPPLHCTIVEESTDADGDAITYTFDWDVDGVEYTDTTALVYDGDAIAGDALAEDETWTCEVTPDDGELAGPMAESSIDIEAESSCGGSAVIDTYEYDGMSYYPLHMDNCTGSGSCGPPWTTQQQMESTHGWW